jgi:biotin transporter BioY
MDAQVAISPKLLAPDAALAAATINPNSAKIATLLTLTLALLLLPFTCAAEGSWGALLGATSNYV